MKRSRTADCTRAAVAGASLLALVGCGPAPDDLAPGQEPYLRYCASCHGNAGEGKAPSFPPLAGSEWLDMGPEAVAVIVLGGLAGEIEVAGRTYRGYMPPMRRVDDDSVAALIGYMGEAWAGWEDLPDAGEIARLRGALRDAGPAQGRDGLMERLDEVSQ
ncbi:MAG: cytochrome c [Wenzhouxiangellaceae bacterium]|nr:cytochrome c [Wenzhouxiangellaceae bacterium]